MMCGDAGYAHLSDEDLEALGAYLGSRRVLLDVRHSSPQRGGPVWEGEVLGAAVPAAAAVVQARRPEPEQGQARAG